MRIIIIIIPLFIVLFQSENMVLSPFSMIKSCYYEKGSIKITKNYSVREIKQFKQFRYLIDQRDTSQFGFRFSENDEATGIRSICIYGSFAFFTDPFHGNIKKVNLTTGEIKSSVVLDKRFECLREIAILHEKLFIITDRENIFVTDTSLSKINEIKIDKYRGEKKIYYQSKDTFCFFRPLEDINELQNQSYQIFAVKFYNTGSFLLDTLYFNDYNSFENSSLGRNSQNVRGMKYEVIKKAGNFYLINQFGTYRVKEDVPLTSKYYNSINIDFMPSKIVFFDSTPQELILSIYTY
jgi:hypothetical protein